VTEDPGQHKWEELKDTGCSVKTYRMRVPGGWLYRHGGDLMCFVPLVKVDPKKPRVK
jgi:hypothetical protein